MNKSPISELLGAPFVIGGTFPNFTSLDQIQELARESHNLIGLAPWERATARDIDTTEKNLRAGFIGTTYINEARLVADENIRDAITQKSLEGLLFELDITYQATGRAAISAMGGLAIGNGSKRFEIKAFDLKARTFGEICVPELINYFARSKSGAINDGGSRGRKSSSHKSSSGLGSE
jgi:hypothetical protein